MERNVPKLRFKGFNDEWQLSNLKKLCDINPKSKELPDKFVYIDLESIIDGVLIKKNIIELKDAPSRAQRLLNVGDVLFQTVRPYQMNNYLFEYELNYKSVASTGYAQLRCKNCISNNKFIYQALHNKKFNNKVMLRCTGTSYPAINSSELVTIPLRIPSLQEQERIANFLTKVDKIIEKQEEKVKNLENYKKGMMQKIFSQEIRFKDENGNEYPEWQKMKLKDVANRFEYGMNSASTEFDGKNKYIRITDIDENTYKYKNDNIVSPEGVLEDKYLVNENDILFTRTGASVGKTYLYDKNDGRLYFAGFLIRVNVNEDNNSRFIFLQTQTNEYKRWVKIMSMRSGQPGINSQEYGMYNVNIPCIDEQNKIADVFEKIDSIIQKENDKNKKLHEFKKGLLQQMFA